MFLGVSWQKTLAAAGAATSCRIAAFGTMTQVLRALGILAILQSTHAFSARLATVVTHRTLRRAKTAFPHQPHMSLKRDPGRVRH